MSYRGVTSAILIGIAVLLTSGGILATDYYDKLTTDQTIHGFRVENTYLNGKEKAFGARFVHEKTGYTIDLFEIQSVPQGFIWINSPPSSDMGEPHTCEHLVLGKGNRGRYVATLEDMSLGKSTAYTSQIYTAYPFSSEGGNEIFFDLFEAKLDALLHPNFTDEEIRREVCHIGVTADPETGELELEEKGTVYTEMVSAFEKYWYYLYGEVDKMLYGEDHILSYNSGGAPDAIRQMQPSDLRAFHVRCYQLNNMGIIITLPKTMPAEEFLGQADQVLNRLDDTPDGPNADPITVQIPPSRSSAEPGKISLTHYPGSNAQEPGNAAFAWPAHLGDLDPQEKILIETFLYCFGGSQTSNLYNKLINSDTRVIDIGATSVWAGIDDHTGHPVFVGVSNIDADKVTRAQLADLRQLIRDELKVIADYEPDSEQLRKFNDRARSRIEQIRKSATEYLNSPPGFGLRGGGGGAWYGMIRDLEKVDGFRKSMLRTEAVSAIEAMLADTDKNIWTDKISEWKLLETTPYAVGCTADPSMLQKAVAEKEERIDGYITAMKARYSAEDTQTALAAYREEFDQTTKELDEIAAQVDLPGFLENPPMTYDPFLDYRVDTVSGSVPLVASTFNSMTSTTIGMALSLRTIPRDLLMYVPLLNQLDQLGVVKDGEVIPFSEMNERLKTEVLSFATYLTTNPRTGRAELVFSGAGSNRGELDSLLGWMNAALFSPYLEPSNLPRLRDIVDNYLSGLRNRMKGSEEA